MMEMSSAADAMPGTAVMGGTGATSALETPTCVLPGLNTNAITCSRALRVGRPHGGPRLGRFRSRLDAKLVNEVQMRPQRACAGRSAAERIDHLLAEARRKAPIRDPVDGRELVARHIEGAEQDIE